MVKPQLKSAVWERDGDQLRIVYDIREQLLISDPDGTVEALLELLGEGGRTVPELARALAAQRPHVPAEDIEAAVQTLDAYRLLEDGQQLDTLSTSEQERHFSNLAFFESFATLARSREQFQQALLQAHVLVLGTGGVGSNTIPHLAGLGIGTLTLLDYDAVAQRNFARQYLYRHSHLGHPKVAQAADWVRDYDPTIKVTALHERITGPEQVAALLTQVNPDVVVVGIDSPRGATGWINAACIDQGIPYVVAGVSDTHGAVWSVEPGISACFSCSQLDDTDDDVQRGHEGAAQALYAGAARTNRAVGPAVGMLGALAAWEVLRYLTRFDQPAYAGRPLVVDFADGCATRHESWLPSPHCRDCVAASHGHGSP